MKPMIVHCAACKHEWVPCFLPAPINDALLNAMKKPCPACGHKKQLMGEIPKAMTEGDATAWLRNGDTGVSSMTIHSVLTGHPMQWEPDVPYDPADFGRCYRLLKVMPSWRARLPEVAAAYPKWTRLVEAWDELTALYESELPSGSAPKLYARIKALIA